jgi:oxygen-dependent protoporphyrinogen oxidase
MEYAGLVVIHAGVKKTARLPRDAFGVLFPSHSSQTFLGIMFNSVLFPHVAPEDKHLLTICLGGVHGASVFDMSDDQILALARREVGDKLGIVNLETLSVWRWKKAIPQYALGHHRIEAQMKQCENENPGIYFIGADSRGVGVPDRVKAAVSFS